MPGEVLAPNYRRLPRRYVEDALSCLSFSIANNPIVRTPSTPPKRASERPCSSLGRPSTAAAAETETDRGFKRSSEVGWLAVFVVVSLFHVIVLSSPLSLVRSSPTCGVWTASPASSLSSSDRVGEQESREEIHCASPLP